jgi:hypothetical protein
MIWLDAHVKKYYTINAYKLNPSIISYGDIWIANENIL